MLAQLVNPQWIWWLQCVEIYLNPIFLLTYLSSAIKNALTLAIAFPSIPSSLGVGMGGVVDWMGAFLGVAGLILFNFAFK
jgi:hypothetical protein